MEKLYKEIQETLSKNRAKEAVLIAEFLEKLGLEKHSLLEETAFKMITSAWDLCVVEDFENLKRKSAEELEEFLEGYNGS